VTPAFWDSSVLVRLCVRQQQSASLQGLIEVYQIAVWWGTPVEMRGAFERLVRTGDMTPADCAVAGVRLGKMRRDWRELQPSDTLRAQAEVFLTHYALKAADSLQLAAAWSWCSGKPQDCVFVSADVQLKEAARKAGFEVVDV
jgi:predicted nucleic acid-binding protein